MRIPSELYRPSLALLTDLYQLTMAYGFWKSGVAEREAVFHLSFRRNPFEGGFTVAAGLASAVDYLAAFRFDASDLEYLGDLPGNDGKPLFERAFLDYLATLSLAVDVEAIPEGTVVFPHEPMLRVRGPVLQAQLLETPLLNILNFQTLIATKAARVCLAARGEQVLEFGLRRAQGIDGALAASRAAYIGGCHATSNVLAGKLFGIPVRGTHAHSWVMFHDDELEAFQTYAATMPNNCVFLVDTYDTLAGVHAAVEVGKWLKDHGHEMVGIRLDSGDLAYLSIEARKILDQGGFPRAKIVASNDLDETLIQSLKEQGAQINVWGVGTKLVTGDSQPALGGVYKLSAIRKPSGASPAGGGENQSSKWTYKVKLSEQAIKVSTPGILQVRRFSDDSGAVADVIFDEARAMPSRCVMVDPLDPTRMRDVSQGSRHEDLLRPVLRGGRPVADLEQDLDRIRSRTQAELARFHAGIKRFVNPHVYPVGLEKSLHELKTQLTIAARGGSR